MLLLDCRCCAAMNIFIMIKLALGKEHGNIQIQELLLPDNAAASEISWLPEPVRAKLKLTQTSIHTSLALAFGHTAILDVDQILRATKRGSLFSVDVFLISLLQQGGRCTDTCSKALYGKTVSLFTTRLLSSVLHSTASTPLDKVNESCGDSQNLCGDSPALQRLLEFVWTHWEDQLDIIRQSAKLVFENVLKIHTAQVDSCKWWSDPFLLSLVQHLMAVSWTYRGKFSALTSLVRLVGTKGLLDLRPHLPSEVIGQLHDTGLACYACDLYLALFTQHLYELASQAKPGIQPGGQKREPLGKSKNVPDKAAMLTLRGLPQEVRERLLVTWVMPVVGALKAGGMGGRQNIIEYMLPRLLKIGDQVLSFMMTQLSSHTEEGRNGQPPRAHYGAIIMCLRRARAMGLFTPGAGGSQAKGQFKGQDMSQTEGQASGHLNGGGESQGIPVRANGQLIDSDMGQAKGQGCLGLWGNQLDPSVLVAALSCQDDQIRLDAFALVIENHKTAEAVSEFEFEMVKLFLPSNLNNQLPAYRQSVIALLKKFFFRIKESFGALTRLLKKSPNDSPASVAKQLYKTFLGWLSSHLLACLYPGSPFAIRTSALAILSMMSTSFISAELDGFSLPASLHRYVHVTSLLACLSDTFEENKREALVILTCYLSNVGQIWDDNEIVEVVHMTLTLACSTRPQDSSTAANLMVTLTRQAKMYPGFWPGGALPASLSPLWEAVPPPASLPSPGPLLLLPLLLSLLDDQIQVAEESLVTAAAHRPMYPTLHCIRLLIQEVDFGHLPLTALPEAQQFLASLLQSCLRLSSVVSPVVMNSSPEGNVPDAILKPGLRVSDAIQAKVKTSSDAIQATVKDGSDAIQDTSVNGSVRSKLEESLALVEAMPEYLVVCCWRSIKEVSLTLGRVTLQIPVALIKQTGDEGTWLLGDDQVLTMGGHFRQQLLESVHRGAFELAYAGFQSFCQMLWNHPAPAFHCLPNNWISAVMAEIQSGDSNSRLCATRRSAGLPYFIQAIVSSEPISAGRKCFHSIMAQLLAMALRRDDGSDSQVHALNVLRTMYKDARLGEDVLPYTEDGLKAAVLGFKSDQWDVRNSATLLLSALMTRIFGVKRSKDESAMSKKNCQTGRSFFHRYPQLYTFLLTELEAATAEVGSSSGVRLHPSLYPVLLVLGRLFPSSLEGSDTSLSLAAFIPHVLKCAASPVMKTRVIAARALRPLTMKARVVEISLQLVGNIPTTLDHGHKASSCIHGSLLQLTELLSLLKGFSVDLRGNFVATLCPVLLQRVWIFSSQNNCFGTRQAFLTFIDALLNVSKTLTVCEDSSLEDLTKHFNMALFREEVYAPHISAVPWFFEYSRKRVQLGLKHLMIPKPHPKEDSIKIEKSQDSIYTDNCHNREQSNSDDLSVSFIKSCLNSPYYEVRLEILKFLDGLFKDENREQFSSADKELEEEFDEEQTESRHADTKSWSADARTRLGIELYEILMLKVKGQEKHSQCREYTFLVLAYLPGMSDILAKHIDNSIAMFSILTDQLEVEQRIEIKSAIVMFASCFFPVILSCSSIETRKVVRNLLNRFETLVKVECSKEESTDFQLACCHLLFLNASLLLRPPLTSSTDQPLTLTYWDLLACLLQDDDLEVKDKAADVLCVVQGSEPGSLHPSQALCSLPWCLVDVHAGQLSQALLGLLSWCLDPGPDQGHLDLEEASERLFDRGEMNAYMDHVAFMRCLSPCLALLLQGDGSGLPYEPTSTSHASEARCAWKPEDLSQVLRDPKVEGYMVKHIAQLSKDLDVLQVKCLRSDMYLNPNRRVSLVQAMCKAKILTMVLSACFDRGTGHLNGITVCLELTEKLKRCTEAFHVDDELLL